MVSSVGSCYSSRLLRRRKRRRRRRRRRDGCAQKFVISTMTFKWEQLCQFPFMNSSELNADGDGGRGRAAWAWCTRSNRWIPPRS